MVVCDAFGFDASLKLAAALHFGVEFGAEEQRHVQDPASEPPMAYLTTWRLALAADRLASSTATTAVIAEEVGFSNEFTFNAAFSRVYGMSPSSYRRTAHDPGAQDVGM